MRLGWVMDIVGPNIAVVGQEKLKIELSNPLLLLF